MRSPDFLTRRKHRREAQKIAERIALAYPINLALHPDADEHDVHVSIFLNEMGYQTIPEESKDRVAACCQTVNGLGYLLAMEFSPIVKNGDNFTVLQFTKYLDNELESLGFPRQSMEQKEEILKALKLDVTGWKEWDESMK
jgi:hypothetical protein